MCPDGAAVSLGCQVETVTGVGTALLALPPGGIYNPVMITVEPARRGGLLSLLAQAAQDVRYGARLLARAPLLTAAAVCTLALGLAMTVVVFSVVNAVLLQPLAAPFSERLVTIATVDEHSPMPMAIVLGPDFVHWRTHAQSFDSMVAYGVSDEPVVTRTGATRARVAMVSEDFWTISGARLAHGRLPTRGEDRALVVSHEFFANELGSDPGRVGSAITYDGKPASIVGVLAPDFRFHFPPSPWAPELRPTELYRLGQIQENMGEQIQLINVVGRLKSGVTIEAARAELEVLRARAAQGQPPRPDRAARLQITPLDEALVGSARRALLVLMLAVTFVLLIVCANVATLLLGRAAGRRTEIAIRAAVGATRARLARQLLVESVMLAALGGAAGLVLARWGLGAAIAIVPHAVPRIGEAAIDVRVLLVAALAACSSALLFGCAPLFSLWRVAPGNMSESVHPTSPSRTRRAALYLAAAQIALAFVLLTGAGLLLKSLWRLHAYPEGFEPRRVLVMNVQLSGARYAEGTQQRAYTAEVLRTVRAASGVESVGISTHGEMLGMVRVDGAPNQTTQEDMARATTFITSTSSGFAAAVGMRIVRGRWLQDDEPAPVVVINEAAARRDFPGQDPIGRRIHFDDTAGRTIVGVAADTKHSELDVPAAPEAYVPYQEGGVFRFMLFARSTGDARDQGPAIRTLVSGVDPTQPVYDVMSLEQALSASIRPRRFNTIVLTVIGATAFVLALVGVYATVALGVAGRVREIGVRIAIGADRGDVMRMILAQGTSAAAAGVIVGLAAAFVLTRSMKSLLFEVTPLDPQVLAAAALTLLAAALAACWIPARAAARIDPIAALRRE
jgi:putative ABC transport system permease protein